MLRDLDQRADLGWCRHHRRGVRQGRWFGPLRRIRVTPAPPARLGEHRREARVDLVHRSRRRAAGLMSAIEVGERLRCHLRDDHPARASGGCSLRTPSCSRGPGGASGPCASVRRSSRRTDRPTTLAHRCASPCSPRSAVRRGRSWRPAGCPGTSAHLTPAAEARLAARLDDQFPQARRAFTHARTTSQLSHRTEPIDHVGWMLDFPGQGAVDGSADRHRTW